MAVPLARSTPRQARYGRMLMGFLAYLVGMNLMLMGTRWLEDGKIAAELGLWWLVLPLLAIALWLYFADGRMRRAKLARVDEARCDETVPEDPRPLRRPRRASARCC